MATKSVQALVEDIRLMSEDGHTLVQEVRALTKTTLKSVEEEVKYGGILFSSAGLQFGGVFAYKEHVSVEFGKARLSQTHMATWRARARGVAISSFEPKKTSPPST